MQRRRHCVACFAGMLIGATVSPGAAVAVETPVQSHPPMRPLPTPSQRPLADGPAFFVDAVQGHDENDGSEAKPWRTVQHATSHLRPGDTLYLRGGTYYEHVVLTVAGAEGQPVTIRSYPGELAVLDGGLREFFEEPATAWKPFTDGAKGEYVSVKAYPQFASRRFVSAFPSNGWEPFYGIEDQRPVVLGNFGDSMVPLHGYRSVTDLRDDRMIWDIGTKFDTEEGMYCGPGLWFNRQTNRIHVRLAHTNLPALGEQNYQGETDPRRLPLVVSGPYGEDVLRINGLKHIVVQDLVLRGASGSALVNVYGAEDVLFDGLTLDGGAPSLLINATSKLRVLNCAFRSLAAPWSSRASMKYRGTPSYVIISQQNRPESHDCEFAYNEFTDGHDFAWVRYIKNLRFHHNFVDRFNDDGFESGAKKRDHELYVSQNLFSRCLLTFTLHEMDRDESPAEVDPGSGVYITRNVLDLRGGTFKSPPRVNAAGELPADAADPQALLEASRICGDHGGPDWPHYFFYHNSVVGANNSWRNYYGFGMGAQGLRDTQRRVLNNIFVQLAGVPGLNFTSTVPDAVLDGNLHWGLVDGPKFPEDYFQKQGRNAFQRKPRGEGWLARDQFADPKFVKLTSTPTAPMNLALTKNSPVVDTGVPIPAPWFDPLRAEDAGPPDIGAFPLGVEPWRIGIHGRLDVHGAMNSPAP